jgi:hypothetical protein
MDLRGRATLALTERTEIRRRRTVMRCRFVGSTNADQQRFLALVRKKVIAIGIACGIRVWRKPGGNMDT